MEISRESWLEKNDSSAFDQLLNQEQLNYLNKITFDSSDFFMKTLSFITVGFLLKTNFYFLLSIVKLDQV